MIKRFAFYLWLVFTFGALVASAADEEQSQMLDQAIYQQNKTLKESVLDVEKLKTDPDAALSGIDMPVLHARLAPTVQRLGRRIVAGFWTFFVSDWWQITVRGILIACALYGIGYYAWMVMTDQIPAGKAYQTIFFKVIVVCTVYLAVAPNIPFVLTKAINKLVLGTRYTNDDLQLVNIHQQSFMRRALQFEAQAALALDGRLNDQFYTYDYMPLPGDLPGTSLMNILSSGSSSPLYSTSNPPKDGIAPIVTVDGEDIRQITPQGFIFVGPPALGTKYRKSSASTGRDILVAPPCPQPVYELRTWAMFPFIDATMTADSGGYTFASPIDSRKVIVPKRPFAANISAAVKLYEDIRASWTKLGEEGKEQDRIDMLEACDTVAETLLRTGWNVLAQDIVDNQAFAFAPDLSGIKPPTINNPNVAGVPIMTLSEEQLKQQMQYAETTAALKKQRDEIMKNFTDYYTAKSKAVAEDLKKLTSSAPNRWTTQYIIPIGLLICNAYIILAIWLLPPLLGLWAAFFLLPPVLGELNNALKKGAAVIIALVLYPVLLQFIILFCFALTEAASDYDTMLDPDRSLAKAVVYGVLPSSSTVTGVAAKTVTSVELVERFKQSDAGIMQLIAWFGVLAVLVGSPAVVAKFILGMGAADALSQPVQQGAVMGGTMAVKSVVHGASSAAGDVLATGSSLARRFDRR